MLGNVWYQHDFGGQQHKCHIGRYRLEIPRYLQALARCKLESKGFSTGAEFYVLGLIFGLEDYLLCGGS